MSDAISAGRGHSSVTFRSLGGDEPFGRRFAGRKAQMKGLAKFTLRVRQVEKGETCQFPGGRPFVGRKSIRPSVSSLQTLNPFPNKYYFV